MNLTEAETRALLASAVLVALAAVGRTLLEPAPGRVSLHGIAVAGDVDSALAVAESLYAGRARRATPMAENERIDPNSADERELDRLPGVGPSLARAIVEYRERNGSFRRLADLERVPGLGSTKVLRLERHVTLPPGSSAVGETAGGSPGADRAGRSGPAGRAEGALAAGRRGAAPATPIDLNRASASELERLPGIGPTRARAIVRWREEHGGFGAVEDLLKVRGIGPATLERLRPLVAVRP